MTNSTTFNFSQSTVSSGSFSFSNASISDNTSATETGVYNVDEWLTKCWFSTSWTNWVMSMSSVPLAFWRIEVRDCCTFCMLKCERTSKAKDPKSYRFTAWFFNLSILHVKLSFCLERLLRSLAMSFRTKSISSLDLKFSRIQSINVLFITTGTSDESELVGDKFCQISASTARTSHRSILCGGETRPYDGISLYDFNALLIFRLAAMICLHIRFAKACPSVNKKTIRSLKLAEYYV